MSEQILPYRCLQFHLLAASILFRLIDAAMETVVIAALREFDVERGHQWVPVPQREAFPELYITGGLHQRAFAACSLDSGPVNSSMAGRSLSSFVKES